MSNTRVLTSAVKPLWASLYSTPPKRHLASSSVVLFSGPLWGDKRKPASDHQKVTLHHGVWSQTDKETKRRQKRLSPLCWKRRELSERELIRPRGSPSWTPELTEGSDPGGAAVTKLHRKSEGKGQDGDDRLHPLSSSASLPLWWHWKEEMPSFKDANSKKVLLTVIYRFLYQINIRQWFLRMEIMLVV